MKKLPIITATILATTACAKHPENIPAQYISPMQYDNYKCKQISAEMQRLSSRVSEVGGNQKKAANNSDVVMGVGLVLFWPALFLLDSNSAQAAEYSRLKGEFDALEQKGIEKNCGLKIQRPVIEVPQEEQKDTDSKTSGIKR